MFDKKSNKKSKPLWGQCDQDLVILILLKISNSLFQTILNNFYLSLFEITINMFDKKSNKLENGFRGTNVSPTHPLC